MLPHVKVFFWVPKEAIVFIPFVDKSVKTYISRHGAVEEWKVILTGKSTQTEREVYLYVPKSFVLLHGSSFYKLIHLNFQ